EEAHRNGKSGGEHEGHGRSAAEPEYLLPPGRVAEEGRTLLSYLGARGGTPADSGLAAKDDSGSGQGFRPPSSSVPNQPAQTVQLKANQAIPSGYKAAPFYCPLAPVVCEANRQIAISGPLRAGLWGVWGGIWASAPTDCVVLANILEQFSRAVP